jgi:hypothetical protein
MTRVLPAGPDERLYFVAVTGESPVHTDWGGEWFGPERVGS